MNLSELTIRHAQDHQPWNVPYDDCFENATTYLPHLRATHAALHGMKTLGKLAAVYEALDHETRSPTAAEMDTLRGMAADLVTVGLRMANLYGFDMAVALVERVREKNGVNLLDLS